MCQIKVFLASVISAHLVVILTLTTLNTIWLNGPLPLNYFVEPDTFGKSCISFKPLNLDQKHEISK